MFNIQVYKHKIFAIYFISIVCSLLLLISYILSLIKIININTNNFYIIFEILIYFFNLLINTFSDWKAKWIIDLKFISSSKLFLCYGILGIIIYSIICTITTLIGYNKDNNKNDLFKFDNFAEYFDDLSKLNCILMI